MSLEEFKLKLILLGHPRILNTFNAYKWALPNNAILFISRAGNIGMTRSNRISEHLFRDFEEAIEHIIADEKE
jgi:hypothetical protein